MTSDNKSIADFLQLDLNRAPYASQMLSACSDHLTNFRVSLKRGWSKFTLENHQ
ncbi:MAG: hypothetical protein OFPII_18410 [Osedax symbiont Rs1]|nr:MAG: hypothetical protein OFPII_18410 [Osedax symbiont Rs1]